MAFDPKELKRLAKACREAGIKHYKAEGIEFTLSDEAPPATPYKKRKAAKEAHQPDEAPSEEGWDTLSEEQKLFYSARDPLFEAEESKQ